MELSAFPYVSNFGISWENVYEIPILLGKEFDAVRSRWVASKEPCRTVAITPDPAAKGRQSTRRIAHNSAFILRNQGVEKNSLTLPRGDVEADPAPSQPLRDAGQGSTISPGDMRHFAVRSFQSKMKRRRGKLLREFQSGNRDSEKRNGAEVERPIFRVTLPGLLHQVFPEELGSEAVALRLICLGAVYVTEYCGIVCETPWKKVVGGSKRTGETSLNISSQVQFHGEPSALANKVKEKSSFDEFRWHTHTRRVKLPRHFQQEKLLVDPQLFLRPNWVVRVHISPRRYLRCQQGLDWNARTLLPQISSALVNPHSGTGALKSVEKRVPVFCSRGNPHGASRMRDLKERLFGDRAEESLSAAVKRHFLFVNKPAGVPSQPHVSNSQECVVTLCDEFVTRKDDASSDRMIGRSAGTGKWKPGSSSLELHSSSPKVESLRLAHRLDCWTTGVLCLCRTKESAQFMSLLLENREKGSAREIESAYQEDAQYPSLPHQSLISTCDRHSNVTSLRRVKSLDLEFSTLLRQGKPRLLPNPVVRTFISSGSNVLPKNGFTLGRRGKGKEQQSTKNPDAKGCHHLESSLGICCGTKHFGSQGVISSSSKPGVLISPPDQDPQRLTGSMSYYNGSQVQKMYLALFRNPAVLLRSCEKINKRGIARSLSCPSLFLKDAGSDAFKRVPDQRCSKTVHHFDPPLELRHYMPPGPRLGFSVPRLASRYAHPEWVECKAQIYSCRILRIPRAEELWRKANHSRSKSFFLGHSLEASPEGGGFDDQSRETPNSQNEARKKTDGDSKSACEKRFNKELPAMHLSQSVRLGRMHGKEESPFFRDLLLLLEETRLTSEWQCANAGRAAPVAAICGLSKAESYTSQVDTSPFLHQATLNPTLPCGCFLNLHHDVLYEARVHLITGRTHQLRAQFTAEGSPLFGDSRYSPLSTIMPRLNPFMIEAAEKRMKHSRHLSCRYRVPNTTDVKRKRSESDGCVALLMKGQSRRDAHDCWMRKSGEKKKGCGLVSSSRVRGCRSHSLPCFYGDQLCDDQLWRDEAAGDTITSGIKKEHSKRSQRDYFITGHQPSLFRRGSCLSQPSIHAALVPHWDMFEKDRMSQKEGSSGSTWRQLVEKDVWSAIALCQEPKVPIGLHAAMLRIEGVARVEAGPPWWEGGIC